jgi:type III secretion protein V
MPFGDAIQTYSILTIGDGLVSQIPALLISISAGMVVTRVASEDESTNLGKDIARQILAQPKAIAVASGILFVMALIPGLPKIPFFLLAAVTGSTSFGLFRAQRLQKDSATAGEPEEQKVPPTSEPEITLTVPVVIEAGAELVPYIDVQTEEGRAFYEKLVQLRNALYGQLGVIFPPIRVAGTLPPMEMNYRFWLHEVPLLSGRIRTDCVLVNESAKKLEIFGIKGESVANPATGKPAAWVSRDQRERVEMAGLHLWDTHDVLMLHLAAFLRKYAKDFIGVQEVQWMLNSIKQYYPTLVDEVVPKPVSLQQLTEVLQQLVEEEVSIRDLKTILQSLSESNKTDRDVLALADRARTGLKRRICYQMTEGKPRLFVYRLDPEVEDVFRNSIRQNANGPYLGMTPDDLRADTKAAHAQIGNLPPTAQKPVILVDTDIRRFVKKALSRNFPDVQTLAYSELTSDIHVQPLGTIGFKGGKEQPQAEQVPALQAG